ncbi:MAG: LysR family transcriptional regulator [Sedimentitalea sp.]
MAKRALLKSLSDVDLRLVRIFVTVTECGGFAASELELNIGRSTISKHISDLEMRLGLTLCHRGPAGFSLTSEGAQVLEAARRLLASIDGFQSDVDDIHRALRGTFRLGIFDQSSTNPAAHIDRAIARFDQLAPDVALEIALHSPNVLEAKVLEGTLDLAVVPIHRQSVSLRYDPLYVEQMTLYCGRGHVLFGAEAAADLNGHKYAGFAFNSPNMMAGRDLGLRRAARVEEEEALLLLIQSGRYLGYLADHVAAGLLAQNQVQAVAPDVTSYASHFAAITRKQPEPGRKTQSFLSCLRVAHEV